MIISTSSEDLQCKSNKNSQANLGQIFTNSRGLILITADIYTYPLNISDKTDGQL